MTTLRALAALIGALCLGGGAAAGEPGLIVIGAVCFILLWLVPL